jgi:hypothetical protein
MTLIQAKRNEYLVGLDMVDPRDQFENLTSCKWWKIAYSCKWARNIVAYKDKWGAINGDFKRIFDYMASIGNNIRYWDLTL